MLASGRALSWRDYFALFLALLRTSLLPLVVIAIVLFLIALILASVRRVW